MKKALILILAICNVLAAESFYDDDAIAEMITVITATSPTYSIPNTTHLYPAQVSLFQVPALAKAKKIIVFDGIPPGQEHLKFAYDKYKQNIQNLTETDHYFANTELVFCEEWGHLSGAISEAIKHVKTPFVFMHQHDLILKKKFDLNGVVATMLVNPNVKYVHMWLGINNRSKGWNRKLDEQIEGTHYVPLTRSFGWSDQCHVASVEYYQNFVLPECDHCFMETAMQRKYDQELAKQGEEAHKLFGTYLYGNLTDGGYIKHTDARKRM